MFSCHCEPVSPLSYFHLNEERALQILMEMNYNYLQVSSNFESGFLIHCIITASETLSLSLTIRLSVCVSIRLFACLYISSFVRPSVCLSNCLSLSPSVCLPVSLSACLFVCLSICEFACLFVCLSVSYSVRYSIERTSGHFTHTFIYVRVTFPNMSFIHFSIFVHVR